MTAQIGTVPIEVEGAENTDGWEGISSEVAEELCELFGGPISDFVLIAINDDTRRWGENQFDGISEDTKAIAKRLQGRVCIIGW